MSFSVLRAPLRRAFVSAPRASFRAPLRKYTTPNPDPAQSSGKGLYWGVGIAVAGGAGYYVWSQTDIGKEAKSAFDSGAQIAKVKANFVPKQEDYQKVYNAVAKILDADNYDDGSYGPVLVRLAWHASGTFDKETGTGGSNYATMRFPAESSHGANNGLAVARTVLEDVKKQYSWISYGDLWTLAGVVAIQEMDGPKIPWRPGRIDGFDHNATPDGRLPDATQGADHLRKIFYRMGFNDQEIVALSGAHALGRCHPDRSGFEGPWTFSPTTLTNAYYKLLFDEKWVWRKWSGPKQLADKKTGTLMMLPTDYTLVTDKQFKQWGKKYADDEALFFKDFASAFSRLLELGVPTAQFVSPQHWEMKTLDEQDVKA